MNKVNCNKINFDNIINSNIYNNSRIFEKDLQKYFLNENKKCINKNILQNNKDYNNITNNSNDYRYYLQKNGI